MTARLGPLGSIRYRGGGGLGRREIGHGFPASVRDSRDALADIIL